MPEKPLPLSRFLRAADEVEATLAFFVEVMVPTLIYPSWLAACMENYLQGRLLGTNRSDSAGAVLVYNVDKEVV